MQAHLNVKTNHNGNSCVIRSILYGRCMHVTQRDIRFSRHNSVSIYQNDARWKWPHPNRMRERQRVSSLWFDEKSWIYCKSETSRTAVKETSEWAEFVSGLAGCAVLKLSWFEFLKISCLLADPLPSLQCVFCFDVLHVKRDRCGEWSVMQDLLTTAGPAMTDYWSEDRASERNEWDEVVERSRGDGCRGSESRCMCGSWCKYRCMLILRWIFIFLF